MYALERKLGELVSTYFDCFFSFTKFSCNKRIIYLKKNSGNKKATLVPFDKYGNSKWKHCNFLLQDVLNSLENKILKPFELRKYRFQNDWNWGQSVSWFLREICNVTLNFFFLKMTLCSIRILFMIIYFLSDQFLGTVLDKIKVVSYIEEKFSLSAFQSFSCER